MQRIAIIGAGGAGKTILADQLSALLDLPVTHLDALRYTADWTVVPEPEFVAAQRAVAATDRWIIDGNSAASMPVRFAAADTIIFLNLPPLVCLWSIARRRLRHRGGRRPDGLHNCITLSFLRFVLRYRHRHAPAARKSITAHGSHAELLELTSRRQVRQLLARLSDTGAEDWGAADGG